MKKTLALVSFLVLALACAAPPTNRDMATEANRNANMTAPAAMTMTEADAIAKEKAIWEAIKTKDYEAFGDMLANDQIEVMDAGVQDKAASIAGVKDFEPSEVVFSDWKYVSIDKDAFVVVYNANMKGKYKGEEFNPQSVRASSAWVAREGKWLAIFHQETPVKPPMTPAPASAAKPMASPAASPMAAATTSADPIANEKIVWDVIKGKNLDAFASMLAADFVEVEPDGFYDKASSVKSISGFDASKAVLSDFKATTIDADAAIVTYVATIPTLAPKGERHSTIWVHRDGKWVAVLHQGGTPVKAAPQATPAMKAAASPTVK